MFNREVDKSESFSVGQKYILVDSTSEFPDGKYFAEVIGVYKYHIVFNVTLDKNSVKACFFGNPISHTTSVTRVNIGTVSKLYYY